jgi:O-antigen/teichoic acid export membrane protein
MSIEKQAASALKWTGLAKLVAQVVSWGVTLVVLRILAPADYGLIAIVSVIIAVLSSIAELGLGASLIQSTTLHRDELAAVSGVVIVCNLAIGVLLALLAPIAAWFYGEPRLTLLIQVAALSFAFYALQTVPQALAYRDMNFKWLAKVEFAGSITSGLVTLALALHGAGVWALLIGSQVQNLVRVVLLMRQPQPWPQFRLKGIRSYLAFGGATTLTRLVGQMAYQSDVIIGGRWLSPQTLGLYSVSLHLATLPMQKIMSVINLVAFPALAKLQNEPQRMRMRMLEASRILTVVSVAALWGMASVAPEFVRIAMGEKWMAAVYALQTVCIVIPLRMLHIIFTTAALGMGNISVNMRSMTATALILPAAFFIGVHWGIDGLASAWVVAIPLISCVAMPRMMKCVGISFAELFAAVRGPLVAGVAMYLTIALVRQFAAALHDVARLVLLIAVGGLVYLGTLRLADRKVFGELRRMVTALRA